ncbi:hypothetical protein PR048_010984 [Dryococelus australis]|uniref:Uncharacterized protein n=1 Tax=Dryococelus australis TaxID=614101 RepID=A0ABQ9HKA7_9NEOP|nr:hypothetical protein PR048_010984 [Dryococelus australis]
MAECRSNPEPFEVIMASEMIADWSKGLAKFFSRTPTARKKPFRIQKCVVLKFNYGIRIKQYCFPALGIVCNKHDLNLLKASRPILKSTTIQDALSLMKFVKPENAQWLQNLMDSIRMDDENNEDDVFSEGEEIYD